MVWCGAGQHYLIISSPCWVSTTTQAGAHYCSKAWWGNEGKLRAVSPGENTWDSEPPSPAGGTGCDGGVELYKYCWAKSYPDGVNALLQFIPPVLVLSVLWVSNQIIKYNHHWHLSGNMMLVDHNVFDLTKLLGRVNNKWFPKGGFLGSHRVRKMDDGDVKINTQSLTLLF